MPAEPTLVTSEVLRRWALPEPGGDKEARGRVLVVGGGAGTSGGVRLAGEAALRAGGGKLQLATAAGAMTALAVAVPESKVLGLSERPDGALAVSAADQVLDAADPETTVLLGPGLDHLPASVALLEAVVPRLASTTVVDALASGFVTEHPDGLRHLAGRCVLTVNPTELARVLDRHEDAVTADQVGAARDAARRTGVTVLCGGRDKAVATPDGTAWLVTEGGPGLGVSGSGDVQAGLVTGLLARGADPAQAAVWGAALHGRAGDRLAASMGPVGFLARELPAQVPALLAELSTRSARG
jgi:hydroxyethylthiazole kinase-like uncharacterized protein yjeF